MATALFLGVCVLFAVGPPAAQAQVLLFDYVGFDYEDPDPDGAQFGEVGSGYVGLGEIPVLFAPLVFDMANYEYTYHISGLTSTSRTVVGSFIIVSYDSGTLAVYEDPLVGGTPRQYGVNPPNATAPSTFTDGTLFLQGNLTNFQFVFNTSNNTGSYDSNFEVTGGSQYVNIPPAQRTGWTFAGATGNALSIPQGYDHQIDGQVFLNDPTPTKAASWGRIKAIYR
jgi:hypothetical protein